MRAHSLLLSHQGVSMPPIARMSQVDRRCVSCWIDRWHTQGFVGFYDKPGAGRPPTRSVDEQQKVQQYLHQDPKDFKRVVSQLEQETAKRVSTKTMKRLLKKKRSVWKRLRQAPAQSPDPQKYARRPEGIRRLQQREAAGECALWYFDGAGFCCTPCVP
jgi:transposase